MTRRQCKLLGSRSPELALIILRQRVVGLICALLCLSASFPAFARNAPPVDLDPYVARSMQTYQVPGIAIAIVKDGKVVLQKGYGVRKLGDPARVDANTLFGIGSNTKAFTAAALATLVDAGKLHWDDPVYERLNGFPEPRVLAEVAPREPAPKPSCALACEESLTGVT